MHLFHGMYSISDVIEIWMELFVFQALDDAEARSAQVPINNYVTNQQKENICDVEIYKGIANDLDPYLGWEST